MATLGRDGPQEKGAHENSPLSDDRPAKAQADPFRSSAHVERYQNQLLTDALEIADLAVGKCQTPWLNVLQRIKTGHWEKALQAIPRLKFVSRDKQYRTPDCLPTFQERLTALVEWRERSGELQREQEATKLPVEGKRQEELMGRQQRTRVENATANESGSAPAPEEPVSPLAESATSSVAKELGLPEAFVESYRLESTADEKLALLDRHLDRVDGATINDISEGKILFVSEDHQAIEKHVLFRVLESPSDTARFRVKVLFSLSHQADSVCNLDKGQIARRLDDGKRAFLFTVKLTRDEIHKGLNPSAFGALLSAIRNVMNVQNATFTFSLEPIEVMRKEFFEKSDFSGGHKAALALLSRFEVAIQRQMSEFEEQARIGKSRGESMAEKQTRDTARGLIISTASTARRPLNDIIQGFNRLVIAEEEKEKGKLLD